jgi:hypothetical protein
MSTLDESTIELNSYGRLRCADGQIVGAPVLVLAGPELSWGRSSMRGNGVPVSILDIERRVGQLCTQRILSD